MPRVHRVLHAPALNGEVRAAAQLLWDYHDLRHELRPTDVGLGLGSHDLGVATRTAELFHQGLFPVVVFSGANAPTTADAFPRGEAVHYAEHARLLGVPGDRILIEPRATNTAENFLFARELLIERGIRARSVMVVSKPYQQRRAYATSRMVWPDVDVVCTSQRIGLDEYVDAIGDADKVLSMLVGDTQRIHLYAAMAYAIPQPIPDEVVEAYELLVAAGYTSRMV